MREKILNNPKKTKFCAAVISNGGEELFRTKFINIIKIKYGWKIFK